MNANFASLVCHNKYHCQERFLREKLYEGVDNVHPQQTEPALFTIGYKGVSQEEYLNKLLKNNVKLLVNVRRNPL